MNICLYIYIHIYLYMPSFQFVRDFDNLVYTYKNEFEYMSVYRSLFKYINKHT